MGKLETSNLVCGLIVRRLQTKKNKIRSEGARLRHVTYFYNFCTSYFIYGMAERTDFKFGA